MGYDDYFTEQIESGIVISGPYLGRVTRIIGFAAMAGSINSMPEIN